MREIDVGRYSKNMLKASLGLTTAVIFERQGITDVMPDNLDLVLVNVSGGFALVSSYLTGEWFFQESKQKFNSSIDQLFDRDPAYYGAIVSGMVSLINTALNMTYIVTTIN